MEVFFGGEKVFDSDVASYTTNTWHEITRTVTAPADNALLAFTGTGVQDEFGALIDNVSLKAVYAGLDDESQSGGIEDGPGDDASGLVAAGTIDFDAGADGLASIAFDEAVVAKDALGNVVALEAIYVDADGMGHVRSVATNWVSDGLGGGILTGTATDIGTVFTAKVDAAGNYTVEMHAPLNHPFTDEDSQNDGAETAWEDNLTLEFGVVVTDGDNDTALGVLAVSVDDDSPVAVLEFRAGTDHWLTTDETAGKQGDEPAGNRAVFADLEASSNIGNTCSPAMMALALAASLENGRANAWTKTSVIIARASANAIATISIDIRGAGPRAASWSIRAIKLHPNDGRSK